MNLQQSKKTILIPMNVRTLQCSFQLFFVRYSYVTERHLFFIAALNEMRGREKELATDPECSVTLERMAYSMDDFVRRVFMDSLSGSYVKAPLHTFLGVLSFPSYETLVRNRFAS